MSRLFLGNIPHSATENEISYWLQSYGFIVKSVDIITDRSTGIPRGFCFATLVDEKEADSAIRILNKKIMGGRAITVNHAVPLKTTTKESQREKVA
jgi:cold-inducible RNA-binding protein